MQSQKTFRWRSRAALKWYRGLKEVILSLEVQPNRCPVTRKNDDLRALLYTHKPNIIVWFILPWGDRSMLKYSTSATVQGESSRGLIVHELGRG